MSPVCLDVENSNGLESLWWVMHQSDEESKRAAAVTLYLDESGTHEGAPIAVVGGVLLNKSGFRAFDTAWNPMLAKHSIAPPLHIKDFRRPSGRLANISNDSRRALFTDVVALINANKLFSIAATLTSDQFQKYFDRTFRREGMSLYGMCFILCAAMNYFLAKQNDYTERIPFLMDVGNEYAEHVRGAHLEMQDPKWQALNVGSLTFDDDERWSALQAADVIAWASRVRAQRETFHNGYEPLTELFDHFHAQEEYPEEAIGQLATALDALRREGKFPV